METATQTKAMVINRTFDAPGELVWKAFTKAEYVKKWWGPENYTAPICQIDLRVGGEYFYCMRSPEGKDYYSKGIYREIFPQQRLVMTDSFADEKGNIVPASYYQMPGDWPMELEVKITFKEEAGKTKMTLEQTGLPDEIFDICRDGWNQSFDKLAASLA